MAVVMIVFRGRDPLGEDIIEIQHPTGITVILVLSAALSVRLPVVSAVASVVVASTEESLMDPLVELDIGMRNWRNWRTIHLFVGLASSCLLHSSRRGRGCVSSTGDWSCWDRR